jgi:hypothetical protein
MVARMKNVLVWLCFLTGCATAPTAEQHAAAVGGATGCFAQGLVSAAESGKGELVVVGIVLMPLCAMLASSTSERPHPALFFPQRHWAPKGRSILFSRK